MVLFKFAQLLFGELYLVSCSHCSLQHRFLCLLVASVCSLFSNYPYISITYVFPGPVCTLVKYGCLPREPSRCWLHGCRCRGLIINCNCVWSSVGRHLFPSYLYRYLVCVFFFGILQTLPVIVLLTNNVGATSSLVLNWRWHKVSYFRYG